MGIKDSFKRGINGAIGGFLNSGDKNNITDSSYKTNIEENINRQYFEPLEYQFQSDNQDINNLQDGTTNTKEETFTQSKLVNDNENIELKNNLGDKLMFDNKMYDKKVDEFQEDVKEFLKKNHGFDADTSVSISDGIMFYFNDVILEKNQVASEQNLKNKLQILFEYEKHYLDLIKEYKEEIKFANSIQEDLRKERANFFTEVLKDVSDTLKKSDVDSSVASNWIQELVDSYVKSLDLSSDLAKTQVIDIIGKIRKDSKNVLNEVFDTNSSN